MPRPLAMLELNSGRLYLSILSCSLSLTSYFLTPRLVAPIPSHRPTTSGHKMYFGSSGLQHVLAASNLRLGYYASGWIGTQSYQTQRLHRIKQEVFAGSLADPEGASSPAHPRHVYCKACTLRARSFFWLLITSPENLPGPWYHSALLHTLFEPQPHDPSNTAQPPHPAF